MRFSSLAHQIPKDVSVVGFDDIPASERITPALTTIHTPKKYLGIAAATTDAGTHPVSGFPPRLFGIRYGIDHPRLHKVVPQKGALIWNITILWTAASFPFLPGWLT